MIINFKRTLQMIPSEKNNTKSETATHDYSKAKRREERGEKMKRDWKLLGGLSTDGRNCCDCQQILDFWILITLILSSEGISSFSQRKSYSHSNAEHIHFTQLSSTDFANSLSKFQSKNVLFSILDECLINNS